MHLIMNIFVLYGKNVILYITLDIQIVLFFFFFFPSKTYVVGTY